MSNNKQSSVEYLMDKLFDPSSMVEEQLEWFEQAKAMHESEIQQAFDEGNPNGFLLKTGEDYYNETFGGDK